MDIDEFLDRELSDLGLQTDKAEKEAIELPEFSGQAGQSSLFDNIRANLSKGSLEQAEQAYVQLWHILLEQKLKWNKELYEQLSALSRQFSGALINAYNDVKRKSEQINELISRAKSFLREGKKEMPFRIYSQIGEINESMPNVFFEEKKIVQERIMDFYKELRNTTDNELVKRVSALIVEITQLIDKINSSISRNDITNAIVNYNKCSELYNQVPEGFLRHKNSLGMRLLDIYKSLSIYMEISNLQRQLSQKPQQAQQFQALEPPPSPFAQSPQMDAHEKLMEANAKKERAKRNIEKGFYNEASKDIGEALSIEPNDAEARAILAKIKTLQ
ncbi:hypothetical protein HYX03_04905 [Candidatus Woesearchaeota archaeon]|nr:hypothetical protein [Candidatus Woesearchaeota archaeon]